MRYNNVGAAKYLHESLSVPLSMPKFYLPEGDFELPILTAIEYTSLDFLKDLSSQSKKSLTSTFKSIESAIQKERDNEDLNLDLSKKYSSEKEAFRHKFYHYRHLHFNPLSVAVRSKNPDMLKFILKMHKFNTFSFILGLTQAALFNQPEMFNILIQQLERNKVSQKERQIIMNNVLYYSKKLSSSGAEEAVTDLTVPNEYQHGIWKEYGYKKPEKTLRIAYCDELKVLYIADILKRSNIKSEKQMYTNAMRIVVSQKLSLLDVYIRNGNLKSFKNELQILFSNVNSYITNKEEKERFHRKLIQMMQQMALQKVAVGKPDEGIKLLHDYFLNSEASSPGESMFEKRLIAAAMADIYNRIQIANQNKFTLQKLSDVNSKESRRLHRIIACYRYSDEPVPIEAADANNKLADMQFKMLVSIVIGSEEYDGRKISGFTEEEMIRLFSLLSLEQRQLIKQHHNAIIREALNLKLVVRQELTHAKNPHLFGPFNEYFSQSPLESRPILAQFKSMPGKRWTHTNRTWQLSLFERIEKDAKKVKTEALDLQFSPDAAAIEKANLNMRDMLLTELGAINFIAWVLSEEKRWSSNPSRLEIIVQEKRFEIMKELERESQDPIDDLDKKANSHFKNWEFSNKPTFVGDFQKKYDLWKSKPDDTDPVWSKLNHRR